MIPVFLSPGICYWIAVMEVCTGSAAAQECCLIWTSQLPGITLVGCVMCEMDEAADQCIATLAKIEIAPPLLDRYWPHIILEAASWFSSTYTVLLFCLLMWWMVLSNSSLTHNVACKITCGISLDCIHYHYILQYLRQYCNGKIFWAGFPHFYQ